MNNNERKKAVITLHGIRTRGVWQKKLVPILAQHELIPYPLDYGHFSAIDLVLPSAREKKLHWLREEIDRIRHESGDPTPSVVAHSFGTYLIGKLIRDYPGQYFDKVIMVGSILPTDYPWQSILAAGRVQWALNEFGKLDVWPTVAGTVIKDAGKAGSEGFKDKSPFLVQNEYLGYKHSDYFADSHFALQWMPTLTQRRRQFAEWMRDMLSNVADMLRIPERQICVQVLLKDAYGNLTLDKGLSLRSKSDNISLSLDRPYGADTPQMMVVKAVQKGESSLGQGADMISDSEVFPVHEKAKYFIVYPIYGASREPIGAVAISLVEGQFRLVPEEVEDVASKLAAYTLSL